MAGKDATYDNCTGSTIIECCDTTGAQWLEPAKVCRLYGRNGVVIVASRRSKRQGGSNG